MLAVFERPERSLCNALKITPYHFFSQVVVKEMGAATRLPATKSNLDADRIQPQLIAITSRGNTTISVMARTITGNQVSETLLLIINL